MNFSDALLNKTIELWPFIVLLIFYVFSMRLQWSMALRWKEKYIVHNLPVVIQIELSKKDMAYEIVKAENKRLRDAVDKLWVDNKIIKEAKAGRPTKK